MLRYFSSPALRHWSLPTLGLLVVGILLTGPVSQVLADDDNLEETLEQVGEAYATAYTSPFLYAFGPNQNSAMYQTASIPWQGLTFGFGIKAMATHLSEDDQTFRKVVRNVDLGDYTDDPAFQGETGDIVMEGPTIFGNTDQNGTVTGYLHGLPVFQEETISGLIETQFVPLATPEAYIGGIMGLKLTLRYFPEMDLGDYGKTSYFGWGLQWNANGVLKQLPVDVMAGFFSQKLKVGDLLDNSASTFFIAASKDFSMATVYGGIAKESSDMTVSYTEADSGLGVEFEVDGEQSARFTLGVTLDLGVKLNVEANRGDMTTYGAGLMFGL